MGNRGYPPEFRRRVLDLVDGGTQGRRGRRDLGVSDQTIYNWRRQERIDRGLVAGSVLDGAGGARRRTRRIRELEAELAVHRRASELLAEGSDPKGGSRRSR